MLFVIHTRKHLSISWIGNKALLVFFSFTNRGTVGKASLLPEYQYQVVFHQQLIVTLSICIDMQP